MNIDDGDVKMRIIWPAKKAGKLLANVTVCINTISYGFITIKGFQIWPSSRFNDRLQEAINITPPSHKSYGKWLPLVWTEKEEQWHQLEGRIYDAYKIAKSKKAWSSQDESIDPDSIPI